MQCSSRIVTTNKPTSKSTDIQYLYIFQDHYTNSCHNEADIVGLHLSNFDQLCFHNAKITDNIN